MRFLHQDINKKSLNSQRYLQTYRLGSEADEMVITHGDLSALHGERSLKNEPLKTLFPPTNPFTK